MDWKLDLYTKIAPRDRAARHRREQHLGPVSITKLSRSAAGGDPAALLRHPLLQPAALHGAGGADRHADHRAGSPRPARGLRHHRARQVGGAGQGHAELHRQPGRHRRHAGDDEGGRDLRPQLRRGRRPHRQEARPRQQRHLPHRRRGRPRHDGARHQDAAGQPQGRPVLRELRHAGGAAEAARRGRARPEDAAPASTRRSARTSCATTPRRATTCPAAARPTRSSPAS